jgi:hypothetical protein
MTENPKTVPTPEELDALEKLEAAATPGEWLEEPWYCEEGGWCATGPHRECDPDSDDELEDTDEPGSGCHKRAQADAALVRAAIPMLPALIAAARRLAELEADVAGYSKAVDNANMVGKVHYEQLTAANARVAELEARAEELTDALHRDRTGLAAALGRVVDSVKGRMWVTEGRGAYEWDDDRYKEEAGEALREAMGIAIQALRDSGTIANKALNGKGFV